VSVLLQWVWTYVTGQRGSRLIVSACRRSECERIARFVEFGMAVAPWGAVEVGHRLKWSPTR